MINETKTQVKLERYSSYRFRSSMITGCYAAIAISIGYIVFYGLHSLLFMQMINLLGIGVFTISILLFKKRKVTLPFLISTIYILISCTTTTHHIGIATNFHLFALILIPFAFVNPYWNKLQISIYSTALISVFIGLIVIYKDASPLLSLPESTITSISIGNLISLIISFTFIFNYYNNAISKIESDLINSNEVLTMRNDEKGVLLKEIHHRVKNNLAIIMSLLRLDERNESSKEHQQFSKEFESRISSIASIHNNIYQSERFDRINLKDYVTDMVSNMKRMFVDTENNISVNIKADECFVPLSDAVPCGLIINEVLANSFTHAFAQGEKGEVAVNVMNNVDGISISIADDGKGFDTQAADNSNSSKGLSIIDCLAEQIDAEYNLCGENGTKFKIKLCDKVHLN